MIEARRRAYLEAMGFDVWVSRAAAEAAQAFAGAEATARLQLGPGEGSTLVVCGEAAHSAGKFAGDLARALGSEPVWAWPDAADGADGQELEAVVDARLITRVVLLGAEVTRRLFPGGVPANVRSAVVATAAAMEELAVSGEARRALWRCLRGGAAQRR